MSKKAYINAYQVISSCLRVRQMNLPIRAYQEYTTTHSVSLIDILGGNEQIFMIFGISIGSAQLINFLYHSCYATLMESFNEVYRSMNVVCISFYFIKEANTTVLNFVYLFCVQETFEFGEDEVGPNGHTKTHRKRRRRSLPKTVVNPDGNFFFYWLMLLTFCVLYNLWTLIVRQSFPELQVFITFHFHFLPNIF